MLRINLGEVKKLTNEVNVPQSHTGLDFNSGLSLGIYIWVSFYFIPPYLSSGGDINLLCCRDKISLAPHLKNILLFKERKIILNKN